MNGKSQDLTFATEFEFGMTDLEEQLRSEDGAQIRLEVARDLASVAAIYRTLISDGLNPAGFAQAESVYAGLSAAYEIITRFPVGAVNQLNGRKATQNG